MRPPARPVRVGLWSRDDCIALAVLLACWAAALAAGSAGREALGDPVRVDRARAALVAERIDPNTASVASLRRLPLIGPTRAEAIVRYRAAAGEARCFRRPEDLMDVPGIGPVAVERARPWLDLPHGEPPADPP